MCVGYIYVWRYIHGCKGIYIADDDLDSNTHNSLLRGTFHSGYPFIMPNISQIHPLKRPADVSEITLRGENISNLDRMADIILHTQVYKVQVQAIGHAKHTHSYTLTYSHYEHI